MNEYTASSGVTVYHGGGNEPLGGIRIQDSDRYRVMISGRNTLALREFFQAEADERLKRWRDPENPERVVYRKGGERIHVLDETDGDYWSVRTRDIEEYGETLPVSSTARAWLAAHPEPKPAWHDAKPGEVWEVMVITGNHEVFAYEDTDGERKFKFADGGSMWATDPGITAGTRIYPPGATS